MSDTFRFGLIGGGSIAAHHVSAIRANPGAQVVAVAEAIPDRGQAFAAEHGIPDVYTDYAEMLRRDDLDAVAVCVPNFLHAPAAIAAMEAGKHVLVEKPMALHSQAAAEMVAVQKATGRTMALGLNLRFREDLRLARQYTAQFGTLYYGRCGWFRRRGIPGWGSWFTQKDKAGGGPLIDIGVHMLDMCLALLGYPEPTYVSGATYAEFGPHKRGLGNWGIPDFERGRYDVEDMASAFINFANGATVVLEVSWALNAVQRQWVEVMGKEGGLSLTIEPKELRIFSEQFGQVVDLVPQPAPEGKDRQLLTANFIHCCQTGEEPETAPRHGLILNRIFDAIYESSKNGGRQVAIRPV